MLKDIVKIDRVYQKSVATVPRVRHVDLLRYFMEHAEQDGPTGTRGCFYKVTKELKVFKKLRQERIANLVIPVGALVRAPHDAFNPHFCPIVQKMRASNAFVHSISDKSGKAFDVGFSIWDRAFKYRTGSTICPEQGFSMEDLSCNSGIHFFLNLIDAYEYQS